MSAATAATLRAAARSARSHLEAPSLAELLDAAAERIEGLEDELANLHSCLREGIRLHAPYTGAGTHGEGWLRWARELTGMRHPGPHDGRDTQLMASCAHPLDDWDEDAGPVLWWCFPIDEPPYCGTPLDDDWPGYHTHWTRIVVPAEPAAGLAEPAA